MLSSELCGLDRMDGKIEGVLPGFYILPILADSKQVEYTRSALLQRPIEEVRYCGAWDLFNSTSRQFTIHLLDL